MALKVDKEEYAHLGKVECVHGSGDSREEWFFDAYRAPSGDTVLSNTDEGKTYLYLRVNESAQDLNILETFETCPVDTVSSPLSVGIRYSSTEISWARTAKRFEDAPTPFTSTDQVMTVDHGNTRDIYLSVPIMEVGEKEFYSARFPALEQSRQSLTERSSSASRAIVELIVTIGLLLLLGWGMATGSGLPLSIFWWGSMAVTAIYIFFPKQTAFEDGFRLWIGAFFLHFCTHFLDTLIAEEVWGQPEAFRFEALHAGLIIFLLFACRHLWLRGYSVLIDAGLAGGGCSCLAFVGGIVFWSIIEEVSYFPWFRWYAGAPPWGYIWPLALSYMLFVRFHDYRKAPLFYDDFLFQVTRLHRIVNSGLEATKAHSHELASLCDDLEDAVQLSRDWRIMALADIGPSFLKLRQALENLSDLGPHLTVHR